VGNHVPYIIHGHYADAGDAAALLSGTILAVCPSDCACPAPLIQRPNGHEATEPQSSDVPVELRAPQGCCIMRRTAGVPRSLQVHGCAHGSDWPLAGPHKLEQLLKQRHQSMGNLCGGRTRPCAALRERELALDAAELVVTSTRQEVDDQWGLSDGFDVRLERKLRQRQRQGLTTYGHYMPHGGKWILLS